MTKHILYIALTILTLSNCASTYYNITPEHRHFSNYETTDFIEYAYSYNSYGFHQNYSYSNREKNSEYSLLTVSIKNNSSAYLNLSNLKAYTSLGQELPFIPLDSYTATVKQKPASYALIILLGISLHYNQVNNLETEHYRVVFDPLITSHALVNVAKAIIANTKHNTNLKKLLLYNKAIAPNTQVEGLIILPTKSGEEIKFKYNR